MPVVVSVLMFIVYYIIDTMGVKFARESVISEGVELSYVVTDKGVTIREDRKMMGHATYPIAIAKNTIV